MQYNRCLTVPCRSDHLITYSGDPNFMSVSNTQRRLYWRRALLATTAALALGQNAAWATCLDGSALPPGGYQIGVAPVAVAANWSPNVFPATEGSDFVRDTSTNDQTTG